MLQSAERRFAVASRALAEQLGPDARVVGGWDGPRVTPPLLSARAMRLIFVWPSETIAGLKPWRDGYEMLVEVDGVDVHVVAHEASKWARLALKQHAPTREIVTSGAMVGDVAIVDQFAQIVSCASGSRLDALDAWLRTARKPADD